MGWAEVESLLAGGGADGVGILRLRKPIREAQSVYFAQDDRA
jgi:hypothetical protein